MHHSCSMTAYETFLPTTTTTTCPIIAGTMYNGSPFIPLGSFRLNQTKIRWYGSDVIWSHYDVHFGHESSHLASSEISKFVHALVPSSKKNVLHILDTTYCQFHVVYIYINYIYIYIYICGQASGAAGAFRVVSCGGGKSVSMA
jgi:hypothetical protein